MWSAPASSNLKTYLPLRQNFSARNFYFAIETHDGLLVPFVSGTSPGQKHNGQRQKQYRYSSESTEHANSLMPMGVFPFAAVQFCLNLSIKAPIQSSIWSASHYGGSKLPFAHGKYSRNRQRHRDPERNFQKSIHRSCPRRARGLNQHNDGNCHARETVTLFELQSRANHHCDKNRQPHPENMAAQEIDENGADHRANCGPCQSV